MTNERIKWYRDQGLHSNVRSGEESLLYAIFGDKAGVSDERWQELHDMYEKEVAEENGWSVAD